MITHDEAQKKILSVATELKTVEMFLSEALNYVSAQDVAYDMNMPPFDKSAMDGYACHRKDLSKDLYLVDTIYAGKIDTLNLLPGQCVKIMTGAPIPQGADMVFMKEDAEVVSEGVVRCKNQDSKDNICYAGEDVQQGDIVIEKGTILKARHLPLLAGAGCYNVRVFAKPEISIIATGTELVEPWKKPALHQIRNSNATQIMGQLGSLSCNYKYLGIKPDSPDVLKGSIADALIHSDVLIMSGGVSEGDFDLIPAVLTELCYTLEVDKTAIQPGKPMVFAHGHGKYIFGLSGNPVASFIQFELYVKPFLWALQGCDYKAIRFQLPLAGTYKRKNSGRHQFVPAQITEQNTVKPIHFNGSAHISALSKADCLLEIPIGVEMLEAHHMVFIRPL